MAKPATAKPAAPISAELATKTLRRPNRSDSHPEVRFDTMLMAFSSSSTPNMTAAIRVGSTPIRESMK